MRIIGIAGGSASGKTSIVRELVNTYPEEIQVLSQDSFYRSYAEFPFEERVTFNYDHPNAFEFDEMKAAIQGLRDGKKVEIPVYDYVRYTRSDETECLEPRDILIVEGLFVLFEEKIRDILDLKVYVQADPDIRLIRRIQRDVKERGRSLDSVLSQYEDTVKPMHEMFISPSKRYADMILPRGVENREGVAILKEHIEHHLRGDGDER